MGSMGRVTRPPSTSTQSVPQSAVGSCPHGPSPAGNSAERRLLWINSALPIISLGAAQVVAVPLQRRKSVCRHDDRHARIAESKRKAVIRSFSVTLALDLCIHRLWISEQRHRLVGQVSSQVQQQAALCRIILPWHPCRRCRPPAIHIGLEVNQPPEWSILQELLESQEIAV